MVPLKEPEKEPIKGTLYRLSLDPCFKGLKAYRGLLWLPSDGTCRTFPYLRLGLGFRVEGIGLIV